MIANNYQRTSTIFIMLACFFVTSLLVSNIIAGKLIEIFGIVLPAAVLIFPITYIFGDILTEVYGFKRSRLIIWTGFAANVFMVVIFLLTVALPYPTFWKNQSAYAAVLGFTPRILVASLIAYFFGEFSNSVILSKMKLITRGRWLWARTIGSTLIGEGIDTIFFISLAFGGLIPVPVLTTMILAQYLWKVSYEILATPLTYFLVNWVKNKEGIDTFDYDIKYNLFSLEVDDEKI